VSLTKGKKLILSENLPITVTRLNDSTKSLQKKILMPASLSDVEQTDRSQEVMAHPIYGWATRLQGNNIPAKAVEVFLNQVRERADKFTNCAGYSPQYAAAAAVLGGMDENKVRALVMLLLT